MVPRISIVTPTFNQAGTIRETIESILKQDYPDLEYLVFDAGSKDGTLDILREYDGDPRFKWVSEPDKGQSDAINKGLDRCTGDVFNWINSDDYLEPGSLKRIADAFEKSPQPDIVSGWTAEFRGEPKDVFNRIQLQVRKSAEASITVGVFCQPSTFWRTEIVRSLGGIDQSLHCVMDWNMWVRYLARYGQDKIVRIDDLVAHYRHHEAAKTNKISDQFYEEAKVVFQNLHLTLGAGKPFLNSEVEKSPLWYRKEFQIGPDFNAERYFSSYAERMVRIHRKKNPGLAREWLRRARLTPWRIKMALRLLFQ